MKENEKKQFLGYRGEAREWSSAERKKRRSTTFSDAKPSLKINGRKKKRTVRSEREDKLAGGENINSRRDSRAPGGEPVHKSEKKGPVR